MYQPLIERRATLSASSAILEKRNPQMSNTLFRIRGLAVCLLENKREEDFWKKKRIEAEESIAALLPGPEKGQKTVTLDDGTKITVERGLSFKSDIGAIENAWCDDQIPPPIKTRTTKLLDEAGYEWLRVNNKGLFDLIAPHVTVKPKKVSVSVKAAK